MGTTMNAMVIAWGVLLLPLLSDAILPRLAHFSYHIFVLFIIIMSYLEWISPLFVSMAFRFPAAEHRPRAARDRRGLLGGYPLGGA